VLRLGQIAEGSSGTSNLPFAGSLSTCGERIVAVRFNTAGT
jgi:hypothetical protein